MLPAILERGGGFVELRSLAFAVNPELLLRHGDRWWSTRRSQEEWVYKKAVKGRAAKPWSKNSTRLWRRRAPDSKLVLVFAVNEKTLERKLRESIKAKGGLALKFIPVCYTGLPDRIILAPGGHIYFVELKTTGKKPSNRQIAVHGLFGKLGFRVWVIDDNSSLKEFLTRVNIDAVYSVGISSTRS